MHAPACRCLSDWHRTYATKGIANSAARADGDASPATCRDGLRSGAGGLCWEHDLVAECPLCCFGSGAAGQDRRLGRHGRGLCRRVAARRIARDRDAAGIPRGTRAVARRPRGVCAARPAGRARARPAGRDARYRCASAAARHACALFDRPGNPYLYACGEPYADNCRCCRSLPDRISNGRSGDSPRSSSAWPMTRARCSICA